MRRSLPLVALGMLSGCYFYVPVAMVEPAVGTRVSAELTTYGSDTLARSVGPGITTLRGDVVTAESTEVILAVTSVADRSGQEQFWKGEPVRVPRVAVHDFQQRKFSLGRSLLLGAAFLGASVVAWDVFKGGVRGGQLPPAGGGGVPK